MTLAIEAVGLVKRLGKTLAVDGADMRRAEDEIRGSDLDWTIFRPPALNGTAATGAHRTAVDRNLPRGFTLSRADLARLHARRARRPGHRAPLHSHRQVTPRSRSPGCRYPHD